MTNQDFLDELKQHTEEEFKQFEEYQNIVLNMFKVTHKILTQNNITYYAAFGTLLGAYRDKGFIPWDFDFDIVISYHDALKVQEVLEKQLPDDMYIISNFNNDNFPYYMMRVCPKGYNHTLHVDIFYYCGLPQNDSQMFRKNLESLYVQKRDKFISFSGNRYQGKIKIIYELIFHLRKMKYIFTTKKRINKKCDKYLSKYNAEDSDKISVFCEHCKELNKNVLGKPQIMDFYNGSIMVPENIEAFLNTYYSDFSQYLPFDVRYKEYVQGLALLKRAKK